MKTPNILFLTWHDAGRWFGCYGTPCVQTPSVDRLAAEGCRFTNAFSACAICSPSRAAILTGRYCQDNGVMFLTNTVNNNRLHVTERHISRRLKQDFDYHTALFGVQHECAHEHVSEVIDPDERIGVDPWPQAGVTAANFDRWLAGRKGDPRPFFAQVGFFESHLGSLYNEAEKPNCPYDWDDENGLHLPPYLVDSEESRKTVGTLQGYLKRGDAAFGRMLDSLREHGYEENTLVVMCVDHGVGLPRAKGSGYDPGHAVACILKWPGVIPAGTTVDAMATQIDYLPTIFELADWECPPEFQGQSFAPHVLGEMTEERNDAIFGHMVETIRTVRTQQYKFIRNFHPPGRYASGPVDAAGMYRSSRGKVGTGQPPPRVELYDLRKDPNEFTNRAADPDYQGILAELDGQLWDFLLDHNDFVVNEPPRNDWQQENRRELEEHCQRVGRACPVVDS